jgi:hypothetical protein
MTFRLIFKEIKFWDEEWIALSESDGRGILQ